MEQPDRPAKQERQQAAKKPEGRALQRKTDHRTHPNPPKKADPAA
jgi:hypothetical protein